MFYVYCVLFSVQIVIGQTLYKYAVDRAAFEASLSYIFSRKMAGFLLSWEFLLGLGFFMSASLLSFWMFTKFQFTTIQAVTIPIVLALSYAAGSWLFKDTLSVLNIFGLFILAVGVVLASIR